MQLGRTDKTTVLISVAFINSEISVDGQKKQITLNMIHIRQHPIEMCLYLYT